MRKLKIGILYVLVIYVLAVISLYVRYFGQLKLKDSVELEHSVKNNSESTMTNVLRPINIFKISLHLTQDNSYMLDYIQKHHLYQPSKDNYQLVYPNSNPSSMADALTKIFKGKRNGVFVDAGARDGELNSNTLEFEIKYNWTGLLIEPNRYFTERLIGKHRKAWFADACISPQTFPQKMNIVHHSKYDKNPSSLFNMTVVDPMSNMTILNDHPNSGFLHSKFKKISECFPIFSILSAVGFFDIDFFSLHVEGLEMKILMTIPFEKVNIQVFAVEFNHIAEQEHALISFMASIGYYSPPTIHAGATNLIFIMNGSTPGNIH